MEQLFFNIDIFSYILHAVQGKGWETFGVVDDPKNGYETVCKLKDSS